MLYTIQLVLNVDIEALLVNRVEILHNHLFSVLLENVESVLIGK